MSWFSCVLVTTLLSCLSLVSCESNCALAKTCGQCIGHSYECEWCSAKIHAGPRCQTKSYSDTNKDWCSEKKYNPTVYIKVYDKNEPINTGEDGKKVVQLQPQAMQIKVRPGHRVNLTVKYRPAKDYPLDVYYLMDYSYTMRGYLNLLQEQGTEIYKSLSILTNNVRLGVGSFIEKPGLPFANPFQNAYAFKNHLALTNDTAKFKSVILDGKSGANLDDPEAGLDALMQAMVCKERLSWRDSARKIIVLCTDSTYHSAGDGKMVGAAKLNDMQCHLDDTDTYNQALVQDYPTVNQINKIAIQENTVVIFNTLNQVKREYVALAERIQGASYVELKNESNIVETITQEYLTAVSNLQMDVVMPSNIRVQLTPDCTKASTCRVVHHQELNITIYITAESCLAGNNVVTIKPMGLSETLAIDVETFCECECEKNGIPNAAECNSKGSLQCGICKCNENSFGDKCQCTGDSTVLDQDKCRAKAGDTVLCSGHGRCSCGTCTCDTGFSGTVCEFNDNGCPRFQGRLCNGRGKCQYNRCHCQAGWTGEDCHCPIDTDPCRAPHSKGVCSDNGNCECGACVCTSVDSANKTYTGPFCENCFDCDEKRCKELEKYVQCVYFKEKKVCDKEFKTSGNVIKVNSTEINAAQYHLAKLCKTVLEDGKYIVFKHKYEDRILHLIIQKELQEPDRANMWIAIGSSIGGIILLGLLAVIAWKVLMDIHDAREYDKFTRMLDEQADLASENPLFKDPTMRTLNPAYKRRSRMH